MEQVKEGYLIDCISGQTLKATPEEVQAVQPFAKKLMEDYGYPVAHIQTRPQWHVKVRPSDVKKEYPVDIAVFSDNKSIASWRRTTLQKASNRRRSSYSLKAYVIFSPPLCGRVKSRERLCCPVFLCHYSGFDPHRKFATTQNFHPTGRTTNDHNGIQYEPCLHRIVHIFVQTYPILGTNFF